VAVITNYKARIEDLAGVLIDTATANDTMHQFIIDGCYDVIAKLEQTNNLNPQEFVIASSPRNTATPSFDVRSERDIFYVERNLIPCKFVPANQRKYVENEASIYLSTDDDPVYYIFNGTLHIRPIPSDSATAYVYYLPEYSVSDIASDSTIDNYPTKYTEHVLLYAAYMVLGKQLLDLIEDVSTNALSMEVIRKMFNENVPADDKDVLDYLSDEDSEMVQTTVQAAQGAMSVTAEKYKWYQDKMQLLKNEYMMKFNIGGEV
tara:strand:- start:2683 stop:3468 length:786 start_codon:yes stop_codon:yes gene_type:complete